MSLAECRAWEHESTKLHITIYRSLLTQIYTSCRYIWWCLIAVYHVTKLSQIGPFPNVMGAIVEIINFHFAIEKRYWFQFVILHNCLLGNRSLSLYLVSFECLGCFGFSLSSFDEMKFKINKLKSCNYLSCACHRCLWTGAFF